MDKRTLVIASLALCGATTVASAGGSHKSTVRASGAQPVLEESRADAGVPLVRPSAVAAGVTVLDKPYDAPLPIGEQSPAGADVLPIANAPPPPPPPPPVWSVKVGAFLSDTLRDWAKTSGWTLVWRLSDTDDFRMDTSNKYQGEFKSVVAELFNSLPASVRIHAELRPDNVPPLLYVTRDEGSR